jgi:NlpC/P60 family
MPKGGRMRKTLEIRTANNRCPFMPELLALPIDDNQALKILLEKGYKIVEFNFLQIARERIGKSKYQLCRSPSEAPDLVDCATFSRWIYGMFGIWLPRYTIQQRELGNTVEFGKHLPGDLIFSGGHWGKFWTDQTDQVGHVGIITGPETVIHAAGSRVGVVETSLKPFTKPLKNFRGIKRICDLNTTTVLEVREGRLIETLDDLRWDILNTFGK